MLFETNFDLFIYTVPALVIAFGTEILKDAPVKTYMYFLFGFFAFEQVAYSFNEGVLTFLSPNLLMLHAIIFCIAMAVFVFQKNYRNSK